ncbi:MAG TPA: sigma 54-interacting transcriptional regulator [Acidobacteriota bacterium]|nr:sigma 54-interacting transcriptional regulator [Acidobacteriota bacterium]
MPRTIAQPQPTQRSDSRLLGSSDAMCQLRDQISVAAQYMEPALVLGESGGGKELVARQIHAHSSRSQAAPEIVNCAGLSPDVLASELFGHRRGAFTGAERDRTGRIRVANGSTLVLDEISEAPPSLQAAVLRAVEYGEVQPVGCDTAFRVDVRFVATSNKTLTDLGGGVGFRADLLHRLAAFVILVPPLAERLDDIDEIAAAYLATLGIRYGRERQLSSGGLALLHQHTFPGNVRELRQILLRAYAASSEEIIAPAAVGEAILPVDREPSSAVPDSRPTSLALEEAVRGRILQAIAMADGNLSQAARPLEIPRSTLQHYLVKYRIEAPTRGRAAR